VCFAEGSRIATPDGEVEVERLAVGDLVTTLTGPRPVVWLGQRSVDVSRLRDPESGRLVRIRAHAFAMGMPHRDLLVTQEHCLYVDGGLTPARMLVNGRSIVIDRTIGAYTYYHVELAEHGILLAEGLPAESYLDTGNRSNFANSAAPALRPAFDLDAGHKSWETHGAAPLTVHPWAVEPIWRRLEARGAELGYGSTLLPPALSTDPELRLITAAGVRLRPVRQIEGSSFFLVPARSTGLRLLSRTAKPTETVGPFMDDRRDLGVRVGQITLWQGRRPKVVTGHLETADLAGWHELEGGPHRWTAGEAALPLEINGQPALIGIEIAAAGPYLADQPDASAARAVA
jgi:hypothetical protein